MPQVILSRRRRLRLDRDDELPMTVVSKISTLGCDRSTIA